jgi:hypothetical protein
MSYVDELDPEANRYYPIKGRELMHDIGIDICFSVAEVRWDKDQLLSLVEN